MLSISWPLERAKDADVRRGMTSAERVRLWLAEYGVLVWMSVLVAVIGSVVSTTTLWLQTIREGHCTTAWYLSRPACDAQEWENWPKYAGFVIYVLLSALFASFAALLVRFGAPDAAMSGITGLKSYFQGFAVPQLLEPRTLSVKLVGVIFAASSGLWIGQEAPLAYVGVVLVSLLCRLLPISEARKREMGLAAAATGIAVAFSAPLGGVLFGLEVFVLDANVLPQRAVWICFVCAAVSVVMLRWIGILSSTWAGLLIPETGLFRVSFDRVWQGVESVPFALLGACGGVYGYFVHKISTRTRSWYQTYPVTSVLVVSLITAVTAYFSEISRMPSMELLADLFAECTPTSNSKLCATASNKHVGGLVATFVLAFVLAPLSFTLRVPSGILFPSIVVGALGGRLMGLLMTEFIERVLPMSLSTSFCPDEKQHCITPGVYALVGAASVLEGVTGLTVSSVVLIFETTGALTFIVPIMIGVIVSKWVGDTFGDSKTIYANWQVQEHLPSLPDLQSAITNQLAASIMTENAETLTIEQNILLESASPSSDGDHRADILSEIPKLHHTCIPVVSEVTQEYKKLIVAKSGLEEPTIVLNPSASLRLVASAMKELGIRVVILCDKGKFKGLITRADIIRHISAPDEFDAAADEFEIEP